MDPVTLIITALTVGATSGLGDTVSQAVKDAYEALKRVLGDRLRDRPDAEMVMKRHEVSPETWRTPLQSELQDAGVDADDEVLLRAKELLDLVAASDLRAAPKYQVEAGGALGVQIGDHSTQYNSFSDPARDRSA